MIKKIYTQNKEIINYLIFGILTTIVNLITYYTLTLTIFNATSPNELQITNLISWITSVSFAYITNKIYVFNYHNQNLIQEIIKFYTSRLTTLLLDIILMHIFVTKLNLNDKIIKLIVAIIIIIINYITSKILVFKNNKENL